MKHIISLNLLACAALVSGCAGPSHLAGGQRAPGTLAVNVSSLLGYEGSFSAARIYVDGGFVGNYEPSNGTVLHLPPGRHTVRVEVPSVYGRYHDNSGATIGRNFSLKGEERIEVLGGDTKQNLVFNGDNLKAKELKQASEN